MKEAQAHIKTVDCSIKGHTHEFATATSLTVLFFQLRWMLKDTLTTSSPFSRPHEQPCMPATHGNR